MKRLKYCFNILTCFLVLIIQSSCEKLITVGIPENQIVQEEVFNNISTINGVVMNIYAKFERELDPLYSAYINSYADDIFYTGSTITAVEFWQSWVSSSNSHNQNLWNKFYAIIYQCNDVIENLEKYKINNYLNQKYHEALFLRSYAYFCLINLYGDVPYISTTNVTVTSVSKRNEKEEIYKQLKNDLQSCIINLPDFNLNDNRIFATKWAASALLSRISLYIKDWNSAEKLSSDIINSNHFILEQNTNINTLFTASSKEIIFQLSTQDGYTTSGSRYLAFSNQSKPEFALNPTFVAQFDEADKRKMYWIDSSLYTSGGTIEKYYFSKKFNNRVVNPNRIENLVLFRLSEQYLIRAEARLMQDNSLGALNDLNEIKKRAGIKEYSDPLNFANLFDEIIAERRKELFCEFSHRFFDLKRWGLATIILSKYKSNWRVYSEFLPIPLNELSYNNQLTQNPGYEK